jgi:Methyltransferase small domain
LADPGPLRPPGVVASRYKFDAEAVLASGAAMNAVRRLADRLRTAGYRNRRDEAAARSASTLFDLALGHPVAADVLATADRHDLAAAGAVDLREGLIAPRFAFMASGELLAIVPNDGATDGDRIYLGIDSMWLLQAALAIAPRGGRAADLGTGTGFVATALSTGYRSVIATDILARTAACAAITLSLNPRPAGHEAVVCVADVAGGLRPGTIDLVTANPPWVPAPGPDDLGRPRVFDDGGPTGFEIPRRFLAEGFNLLRPNGVLVAVMMDGTWESGRQPFSDLCRGLGQAGHQVMVLPTEADTSWPGLLAALVERTPGLSAARHVAVVIRRRDAMPLLDEAELDPTTGSAGRCESR